MVRKNAGTSEGSGVRRGRPKAGERKERQRRVLDAAFEELLSSGFEGLTMLKVARRAGASKETLYNWFGSKEGLFEAMISQNADLSAERVQAALKSDADPVATLTGYAVGLLSLLTGEQSIALNRAAMSSPELSTVLLQSGRHRVGPMVEAYLEKLDDGGRITIDSSAAAFQLLYGLVVRDIQIRCLLGERPPSKAAVRKQATAAVTQFIALCTPD